MEDNKSRAAYKQDRIKSHVIIDNGTDFLSIEDVEAIYGFSVSTLAKWRMQNKYLKFYKIGKYIRYRKSEIESFLLSQVNEVK